VKALVAVLVLVPALALAQASRPAPTQKIEFGEGDLIDGTVSQPDVTMIDPPQRPRLEPLIQVRKDFNDKIRSAQIP